LLGGPWTRLVNDGFIIDPRGSGFFSVSEEGLAANGNESKPAPVSVENDKKTEVDGTPTAFISYSWDSEEHKLWVRHLAEKLRSQGVKVILDQWHLNVGGDRTYFMETSITASDFVVIICTTGYVAKGNKRDGGVGYEAMIITSQLARNIHQDKFIPVLRSGNWDDSSVPIWLQSKIGVDLRGDPYDRRQYDILIRGLHKAHDIAPPVGSKPVFVVSNADIIDNAVSALLQQEGEPTTASLAIETNRASEEPQRSPIAYAWYEMKGKADRIQAYVRPTADQLFKFDTSSGEILKGTESAVAQRYLAFDLELRRNGYTRMQTFNGSGGQSFNLP
jgi:hypothetical protein